tara:strand:- start:874 stop:1077 length:204 start_codon:yes stop_codon:yes gene_type:complete
MDNLIYSGVYVSEGHSITYIINDNDTVTITETYKANGQDIETNQIVDIDKAIDYQQKYIDLGYDKIS